MAKKKRSVGRPSQFDAKWKDKLPQIEGWARDGLIDEQIAVKMGISERTLYNWKTKYPELVQSLKKGKEEVDYEVEKTLLKRAMGYEYEEVKIIEEVVDGNVRKRVEKTKKHMPADATSIFFWLKNRNSEKWTNGRTELDKLEQQVRIEKLQAQTDAIKGMTGDIENTADLRKMLLNE